MPLRNMCFVRTIAQFLGCVLTILGLQACTTATPPDIVLDRAPGRLPFPGTKLRSVGTAPVYQGKLPARLERFVIGQGSGLMGFQSIALDSAGSLEVVWQSQDRKTHQYLKSTTRLSPEVAAEWLSKPLLKRFLRMHAYYSAGLNDGGQGFAMADAGGRVIVISHYDNAYPEPYPAAWTELRKLVYSVPRSAWKVRREKDGFAISRQLSTCR